tara:strand:- start:1356 stop:1880 length:525 start_codon:yes stop_codon:yes gene_type:complete
MGEVTKGKPVGLNYSYHQFGKIVVAMLLPVIGLLGVLFAVITQPVFVSVFLSIMLAAFVLFLLLFCSLRVEVSREYLKVCFGLGLIRRSFEIIEIVDAYPVRNKWYWGLGIRLTPHGWLYNIQGLDAVEIVMRSSEKYRIGTPEPEELARALQNAATAIREAAPPVVQSPGVRG